MLISGFDDVLPAFGYNRVQEAAMPKLRFWITALAVIFAGLIVGVMSLPASWVSTAQWGPQSCWRPGLARNIGIAEQGCD